jgi:hypothetical protein
VLDHVAAIDAWLDSAAAADGLEVVRINEREGAGTYLWVVAGFPIEAGRVELQFRDTEPGIVLVRLVGVCEASPWPGLTALVPAAAADGVQPIADTRASGEQRVPWPDREALATVLRAQAMPAADAVVGWGC